MTAPGGAPRDPRKTTKSERSSWNPHRSHIVSIGNLELQSSAEAAMTTRDRWGIGIAAMVILGLLFYGLRTQRPGPNALPPPAPSARAPAPSPQATSATAQPATTAPKNDLSPKAA